MTIQPPSHDTCVECWKYKNELDAISCVTNDKRRAQVFSSSLREQEERTLEEVEQERIQNNNNEELDGENDMTNTSAIKTGRDDNDNITNMNVENYYSVVETENVSSSCYLLGESYAELAPACVRGKETVLSKFTRHVHQPNMRNLLVKNVKQ